RQASAHEGRQRGGPLHEFQRRDELPGPGGATVSRPPRPAGAAGSHLHAGEVRAMRGIRLRTVVKVLAFVLASAVFTIGLAMKIGNLQLFSHTYGLSAVFSDASGVFKGDEVKLAGVDVGRVTGTEIENGKAVVHFDVDKDVKLTTDSIVAIRWRNVLGLRFLYAYPGNGSARDLHAG